MRWWLSLLVCATAASAAPRARAVDVELGRPFRLEAGGVARIAGGRATLRIVRFENHPCPQGAQCAWSGQAVDFELRVGGKAVPAGAPDSAYEVDVKDSDYASYAVFVVDEPERACARLEAAQAGECIRNLANRRRAPRLCRSIVDKRTRGLCLEDLAGELQEPALCRDVPTPSQYCLYVRSKAAGDMAACDGIILFRWRVRCFKEFERELGPGACATLGGDLARRCRDYVAGGDQ